MNLTKFKKARHAKKTLDDFLFEKESICFFLKYTISRKV